MLRDLARCSARNRSTIRHGAKSNPSRGRCFFISTAAIAAVLVPFFGVIVITIPAAIVGIIALCGGDRKLGMVVYARAFG